MTSIMKKLREMNAAGHPKHVYQSLPFADHVRLVELLPADDGPIHIKLHVCSLAKAPPYTALSYIWGDPQRRDSIICEGHEMEVGTANLLRALQAIRLSTKSLWLWVDQLSIDQRNQQEKETTVIRMGEIYRMATRTICWIGVESFDPFQSLELLIDASRQIYKYDDMTVACLRGTDVLHSPSKIEQIHLERIETARSNMDFINWSDIETICDNHYFTRAWMTQDVMCSRDLVIFDGLTYIPWSDFAQALVAWTFLNPLPTLMSPATMFVLQFESIRRQYHDVKTPTINVSDILLALHSVPLKATVQVDYVNPAYSIGLGLNLGFHRHQIDYKLAPDVAFGTASSDLNEMARQPLSLSLVNHARSDLPSWCPDWATFGRRLLLNHPTSNFSASRATTPDLNYGNFSFSCLVVDTIRAASDYMPTRRHCDHYTVSGDNSVFFGEWFEFAKENSKKRNEEDLLLEYADTIQARGCNHIWEQQGTSIPDRLQAVRDFLNFLENPDAQETYAIQLFYAACFPATGRKFGITRDRHFCLVPEATKRGDLVCIPLGSRVPYLIRLQEEGDGYTRWQNIGEAYVHGMMHGEAEGIEGLEPQIFDVW